MRYKGYLLFFLALLGFIWIVKFNGLYGQDSYEYLRYTKCLVGFVKTGTNPGDYFWPILYPIAGTIFSFLLPLPFALQFISMLSLILSAIFLHKILILFLGAEKDVALIYIYLFFLLSPYVLRGSLVVMADSLTILCIVATVYYFEQYRRTLSGKYFPALIFFSAAAISTRYAAFVVLAPFIAPALFNFFRNFKVLTFISSILIVIAMFTPHIIIRNHSLFSFIHHEWFDTWSPFNFFRTRFITSDGYSSYSLYNIIYAFFNIFHPAFCFAGIILFIACIKLGSAKWGLAGMQPLMISILMYALFMAGIPFQDMRYLLLSFPLVLILLFPGYESFRQYLKRKKLWSWCLLIIVVTQLGLFCRVFIPFYDDNKVEKEIARSMLKYSGKSLYTFSIDGALQGYGFSGKVINMWKVRLDTVKSLDTNFLVLYNGEQFSEAGKDWNPILNWGFLNKKFKLVKIKDMPDNWALYSDSPLGKGN